jgi:hypothetical protein
VWSPGSIRVEVSEGCCLGSGRARASYACGGAVEKRTAFKLLLVQALSAGRAVPPRRVTAGDGTDVCITCRAASQHRCAAQLARRVLPKQMEQCRQQARGRVPRC